MIRGVLVLALAIGAMASPPSHDAIASSTHAVPAPLQWLAVKNWRERDLPIDHEGVLDVRWTVGAVRDAKGRQYDILFFRVRRDDRTILVAAPCPETMPVHWTRPYFNQRRCDGPAQDFTDRFMSLEADILDTLVPQQEEGVDLLVDSGDWRRSVLPPARLQALGARFTARHGLDLVQIDPATLGVRAPRNGGGAVLIRLKLDHVEFDTTGER